MRKQITLALVLALLLPAVALSRGLPYGYPEEVMTEGIVSRVDLRNSFASIADRHFRLTAETRIHRPNTQKEGSSFDLRPMQRVGIDYTFDDNDERVLTDIWILPKGASFFE